VYAGSSQNNWVLMKIAADGNSGSQIDGSGSLSASFGLGLGFSRLPGGDLYLGVYALVTTSSNAFTGTALSGSYSFSTSSLSGVALVRFHDSTACTQNCNLFLCSSSAIYPSKTCYSNGSNPPLPYVYSPCGLTGPGGLPNCQNSDCYGHGVCAQVGPNHCVCDGGWTGSYCNTTTATLELEDDAGAILIGANPSNLITIARSDCLLTINAPVAVPVLILNGQNLTAIILDLYAQIYALQNP